MIVLFYKYQGTGNDFILIDNRKTGLQLTPKQVARLCNRNFGIGADGLMLLENFKGYDFKMVYFNSDGNLSSMCGNGGRCIVKFAHDRGIIKNTYHFLAPDGPHEAIIKNNTVELKMCQTQLPTKYEKDFFINTGSPHYVRFVDNVRAVDVFKQGKKIRNSANFKKEGTNVNFVEVFGEKLLFVRTYERGVENETLSCGTGVTAAALTYASIKQLQKGTIKVETLGGKLSVKFVRNKNVFKDIWLIGPAVRTFSGIIELE